MKKTIILLFIIIVLFASIHFALFLDDVTDITGASIKDNELKQESAENIYTENKEDIEVITEKEEDFYDYL